MIQAFASRTKYKYLECYSTQVYEKHIYAQYLGHDMFSLASMNSKLTLKVRNDSMRFSFLLCIMYLNYRKHSAHRFVPGRHLSNLYHEE